MKKTYKKAKLMAKNLPAGSYAAGCPEKGYGGEYPSCKMCERMS